MRVVAFVNNAVGLHALQLMRDHGDELVAVVAHPRGSAKHLNEILAIAKNANALVVDAPGLRNPETVKEIGALEPEIGVSAFFGHILRRDVIDLFPRGIVNVHPAYLPYNRGAYPNVWAIVDGTPAGATIHYIDEGVDTGNIIDRIEVQTVPSDTGGSLYRKLESACRELFAQAWPKIAASPGRVASTPQDPSAGTSHRMGDVSSIDRIDLDRTYRAGELIDIIRARTFEGYHGAYFERDGKRYYLRIGIDNETAGGTDT